MPLRIACTIFLFISVSAFPLFFTLGVGLFSVIWFRNYYELIPLYFLHDVLYGVPMHRFFNVPYSMTIAACACVCLAVVIRTQVFDATNQKI